MSVHELLAAFKASRSSLSNHRLANKTEPRTARARRGLASLGVSTRLGGDGGVYVTNASLPATALIEPKGTPVPTEVAEAQSAAYRTLGEMSPEERLEAAKHAAGRLNKELNDNADEIAAALESLPKPKRVRKPKPCSCSCNSDAPTAKVCAGEAGGCGHKGCRFAL
jgi:hypothetical protein